MKEMIIKIVLGFLAVLVVAIIVFFAWYCVIHDGSIREYRDENGNILAGSVSEKLILPINGVDNGLFINGTNIDNPVLLFVSSGPGTDDYFLNEKYPDMHLEDAYTVCYWDYRGMGIAYDRDIDPATIDLDTVVEDANAVTEYLKERFGKDKIYIMGFSGGTRIAVAAADRYPEQYYAYIGMAQIVCRGAENDTLMYQFMKKTFEERNDKKRLKKLEGMVTIREDGQVVCKDWFEYVMLLHEAGGGTTMNETELVGIDIPIMLSHCYTVRESFNYIRGMKMYRNTPLHNNGSKDFRVDYNSFDIPVYFISGDHDYNTPWPLVKQYCDMVEAPDKEFYLVENAAHSPLWEQQQASYEIMCEIKEKTSGK